MPSVFTMIIQRELPCHLVHEDDETIAFLARDSIRLGHTLVVPKVEVDHFLDVPEPHYSAVWSVTKRVGKAIQQVTGCTRVGTMTLGWDVPHFHHHLVPMWGMGDVDFRAAKVFPDDEYAGMAEKLRQALAEGGA